MGRLEHTEAFNQENYRLFRAYLESGRDEVRAIDLGLAAFVCVTSIEALTHTAVLHHPEGLSDKAVGALRRGHSAINPVSAVTGSGRIPPPI